MFEKKVGLISLVILIILSGCQKIKFKLPDTTLVGRVGKVLIFERDIQLTKSAISACFPNLEKKLTDEGAFTYLFKGFISEEICRKWGYNIEKLITSKEINDLKNKCDSPQLLEELFGNNQRLFLKDFVIPMLATKKLFEKIYNGNPSAHKKIYTKARKFLKSVLNGEDFYEAGKRFHARLFTVKITERTHFDWSPTGKRYPYGNPITTLENKKIYLKIVKKTKEGELYSRIIEQIDGFEIFNLLQKTGDSATLLMAYFPKKTWNEFYADEAGKINIVMKDPSYYLAVKDKIGWMHGIKVIY